MSWSMTRGAVALVGALLLAASGCGPRLTPEEEIERLRSQYTAELKSLTVKQDPVAPAVDVATGATGEAGDEAAAGATPSPSAPEIDASAQTAETAEDLAEGETPETSIVRDPAAPGATPAEIATIAGPQVRTDVILDILVSTTSDEYLPGITLDVEHVDAERREKDRRTLWVDTSALVRGGGTPVTHVLENVEWDEGDAFYVEVRTPVPAEERASYREFQGE
jgi:hypothetical protein